jgi:hypothetical protein
MFKPSKHSHYGNADGAQASGDYSVMLEQYAPGLNKLIFGGDARESVARTQAKIVNLEGLRDATSNQFLTNIYNMQLNKLYAQLEASQSELIESETTQQTERVAQALAIIAGMAAIVLIAQGTLTLRSVSRRADRG